MCKMECSFYNLQRVWKVKFAKYRTCARGKSGEDVGFSRLWTGFSIIVELEHPMPQAYLRKTMFWSLSLGWFPPFANNIHKIVTQQPKPPMTNMRAA